MKLIYFHGFGSSAQSGTIKTLKELLPDFQVIAPDIPVDPAEALPFLKQLCKEEHPDVVVGTSMGGMYAQQMTGFKRICVNPAFEMSKKSKVLKIGTFEYFKPRMDGETHFTITTEIIKHFAEMEAKQFEDVINDKEQDELVWGLFGNDDKQVNGESLFCQYYSYVIHFEGEHRMSDKVINDVLIPLVNEICTIKDDYETNNNNPFVSFEDENGKMGFKNPLTHEIYIEPTYDWVSEFHEGLAAVGLNDKFGYIDKQNKIVIPLAYSRVEDFYNGQAIVYNQDGKELEIDKNGSLHLIKEERNGKYGYVDYHGNVVIPFVYEEVMGFSEGLCAVKKEGKWGYINREGNVVIPFEYEYAADFSDGLAIVRIEHRYYEYITQNGDSVFNDWFTEATSFSEGIARVTVEIDRSPYMSNEEIHFIDKTGRTCFYAPCDLYFGDSRPFHNGRAAIK